LKLLWLTSNSTFQLRFKADYLKGCPSFHPGKIQV